MPKEYSLYEAKAKLSALVREVREGNTLIITVHGEPAAELRPIPAPAKAQTNEERFAELEALGLMTRGTMKPSDPRAFPRGKHIPGALQRFLDERD